MVQWRTEAEGGEHRPPLHDSESHEGTALMKQYASAPAAERTLITQLLGHFKQTAEVRQYLRYYGAVLGDRFAVVKISGDVLHSEAESARVASALAFLQRIGLVPIVVHGAGLFTGRKSQQVATAAQEDTAAADPAARAARIMHAAEDYMASATASLLRALRTEGVEAVPFIDGVFEAEEDDDYEGELAGVKGVVHRANGEPIRNAIQQGKIPIVAARCTGGNGRLLTFPTQDAALEIASVMQPLKVIWLRPEGGLRTSAGDMVRSVDLCRDAPQLVPGLTDVTHDHKASNSDAFSAEEFDSGSGTTAEPEYTDVELRQAAAEVVREELDLSPSDASSLVELASFHNVLSTPGSTVSVTTPEYLAQELFTHRGAGTLISRGERIFAHSTLATLDLPRLKALIEAAFGAPLPDSYLDNLATSGKLKRIYISEGYRGVAIVLDGDKLGDASLVPDVSYLDKFAVDPSAQGDKLGEVLWKAMTQRETKLFWRSRSSNRVNPWYYEQSHGCYKAGATSKFKTTGEWTVFWRNLPEELVMRAVQVAVALPPTFAPTIYHARSTKTDYEPAPPVSQPELK